MKKQIRLIATIVICIAVLGGAWFLLSDSDNAKQAEESSSASAREEQMNLMTHKKGDMLRIHVANEKGGYTAKCTADTVNVENLDGIPMNDSAVSEILSAPVSIRANTQIADGEQRMAEFGLAGNAGEVTMTFQDGSEEVLSVGDAVPGSEVASHYVLYQNGVYVVYDTYLKPFLYGEEDLITDQLTPENDSFTIQSASLSGSGFEEPIALELTDTQELSGYLLNSYQLTAPFSYPADLASAEEYLSSFFGLTANAVVKIQPTDEEIVEYGLKEPWAKIEVAYKDAGGTAQSFALQTAAPDAQGNAFCIVDGIPVVYQCNLADAVWISETAENLVSREVLVPALRSLRSVSIQKESGETITLEIRETDAAGSDTDSDANAYQVFYGEQELDLDSFKNYYYTLVSQSADEVLLENLPSAVGMPVAAVVTYEYADESRAADIVTYYQESDRELYAEINQGERGCRLPYTQLQQMLTCLDQLIAGEKIEARY